MKEIIHKASCITMFIFVITNFLSLGTVYWYISIILWGTSAIIYYLTGDF